MQVHDPLRDLSRPLELHHPVWMLRVRNAPQSLHLLCVRLRQIREQLLERAVRHEWSEEAAQALRAVDDDGGHLNHAWRGPLSEEVDLLQHVFDVARTLFERVLAPLPRHTVDVRPEARRTELRERADLHGGDAGQRGRDGRVCDDLFCLFAKRVRRLLSLCTRAQCDAGGGREEEGDGGDGTLEGLEQGTMGKSTHVVLEEGVLQRTRHA